MRDRLIHGCDSVEFDELWKTSTDDISALLEQVKKIRASLRQRDAQILGRSWSRLGGSAARGKVARC